MAKYLPFRSKELWPSDVKAVYVPVWYIDGEVAGKMLPSRVLRCEECTCVIKVWSHGFLGVNDDSSIKHVRMTCRVQILTGIDVGLRALGVCLVGPIVKKLIRVISPAPTCFSFSLRPSVNHLLPPTVGVGRTSSSFYPRTATPIRHRHFLYTIFNVTHPNTGGYQVIEPSPN